MVDVVKGKFTQASKGNKVAVFLGVSAALIIAGLPLLNKRVYDTEQKMAAMRDGQYDAMEAKNEARQARLSGPKRG